VTILLAQFVSMLQVSFQFSVSSFLADSVPRNARNEKHMSKTALLFAGQGAQVVGMGKDLAEQFPSARAWFDRADTVLGYNLAGICFNGPEADLTKTENAQP